MKIKFDEQEDDWWICNDYSLGNDKPPICVTLTSDDQPSDEYMEIASSKLKDIDGFILSAAELILENYSYEHYKNLGVPEESLEKEETPEAMSKRAVLKSVWFMSAECRDFELSFELSWDKYHSYDIEFEENEATSCAVNG